MSLVFPARLFWYRVAATAVGLLLNIAMAINRVPGGYRDLHKA